MGTKQEIKKFVYGKIKRLQALPYNQNRAEMAELRRGIGHAPGEIPQLWGSFLAEMPEEFQGRKTASHEEWAIYLALTYYALHQQGNEADMNHEGYGLGKAVRLLAERNTSAQDWEDSSVIRRFNAVITARDIHEISHHLRGMIQLLRGAKGGGIPLDYPQLAADLYGLQCDIPGLEHIPADIKLRWGQELYANTHKETMKQEENDYEEAPIC